MDTFWTQKLYNQPKFNRRTVIKNAFKQAFYGLRGIRLYTKTRLILFRILVPLPHENPGNHDGYGVFLLIWGQAIWTVWTHFVFTFIKAYI